MNALIVFRFFSGVFGSAPLTNGGGTIADMILQEHRGAAMASFAIGPLLGPIIGPVIGGVVTSSAGWRWVFWIIAIICGVISILFLFFARETYAPTLLQKKVNRLRKETGNPNLRSKLDTGLSAQEHFSRAILRPMKLLVLSPICAICNLYVGIVYAYLYLMFTSLTPLFEQVYNFDTVHAGLTFLGLGVGSMAGVVYFSASSDKYMKKKAAEEKAALVASGQADSEQDLSSLPMKPEYRLAPLRIGAILLPAGFFIYGWTAYYKTHWIAPIIGTAIIGVGNLIVFMVCPYKQSSLTTRGILTLCVVSSAVSCRRVYHVCRLRTRSKRRCPIRRWRRASSCRASHVREARPWLGQQSACLYCRRAHSYPVAVYEARCVSQKEIRD